MILAIDFDGVLHDHKHPKSGRRMGPPMEGAQEGMRDLLQAGHTLIIHTVWEEGRHPVIADWMDYYAIPYHTITNVKPQADLYLDDHGLRFSSWDQTLKDIHE